MSNTNINKPSIPFAIFSLSYDRENEKFQICGAIRKSDVEKFLDIRNLCSPEYMLWDEEDDQAGSCRIIAPCYSAGGRAGAEEREVVDSVLVEAVLPDYSNATQAFYFSTGVQVDARFL